VGLYTELLYAVIPTLFLFTFLLLPGKFLVQYFRNGLFNSLYNNALFIFECFCGQQDS